MKAPSASRDACNVTEADGYVKRNLRESYAQSLCKLCRAIGPHLYGRHGEESRLEKRRVSRSR